MFQTTDQINDIFHDTNPYSAMNPNYEMAKSLSCHLHSLMLFLNKLVLTFPTKKTKMLHRANVGWLIDVYFIEHSSSQMLYGIFTYMSFLDMFGIHLGW